jgi:hypothetical protein
MVRWSPRPPIVDADARRQPATSSVDSGRDDYRISDVSSMSIIRA